MKYRYGATALGVVIGVAFTALFGILIVATVARQSINWGAVATVAGTAVAATYYVTYLRHSRGTARRENLFKLQDEYNGSYVRRTRFHLAQAFLNQKFDPSCLRTLMLLFQKLATMIERDEVDDSAAYGLFAIALIRWCAAAETMGALANVQRPASSWDRMLKLRDQWAKRYRDQPPEGITGFLEHEVHRSQLDFATPAELTASEIDRLTARVGVLEKEIAELRAGKAAQVGG